MQIMRFIARKLKSFPATNLYLYKFGGFSFTSFADKRRLPVSTRDGSSESMAFTTATSTE